MTKSLTLSTEEEVAKLLRTTTRQLRTLGRSGKIPVVKVSRYLRLYDPEKVVAALERVGTKTKGTASTK
jgi:hypothetical protein